jgi:hypothetical protein
MLVTFAAISIQGPVEAKRLNRRDESHTPGLSDVVAGLQATVEAHSREMGQLRSDIKGLSRANEQLMSRLEACEQDGHRTDNGSRRRRLHEAPTEAGHGEQTQITSESVRTMTINVTHDLFIDGTVWWHGREWSPYYEPSAQPSAAPSLPPTPQPTPQPTVDRCTNNPVFSLVQGGNVGSLSTTNGGHTGTTLDPLDTFNGGMIMWTTPSSYDVIFAIDFPGPVTVFGVTCTYDAGADVTLYTDAGTVAGSSCYATNGNSLLGSSTCTVVGTGLSASTFYLKVASHHGGWNWFGDCRLQCAGLSQCAAPATMMLSQGPIGSLSTINGGHTGTTLDPLDTFNGGMVMWTTPSAADDVFVLSYTEPVTLFGVICSYDAGATVSVYTYSGSVASADCYATNGGSVSTCSALGSGLTDTTFFVKIDSHHGGWNWMGNCVLQC